MLDETMLALILQVLEPKFILVDHQYVHVVLNALKTLNQTVPSCKLPILILIPDCDQKTPSSSSNNNLVPHENLQTHVLNYNDTLEEQDHFGYEFEITRPTNNCDPISVNYTLGSIGNSKGIYSHRVVYMNSLAIIRNIDKKPVSVHKLYNHGMTKALVHKLSNLGDLM